MPLLLGNFGRELIELLLRMYNDGNNPASKLLHTTSINRRDTSWRHCPYMDIQLGQFTCYCSVVGNAMEPTVNTAAVRRIGFK